MGRELSYAFISNKLIQDIGRDKLQEKLNRYDYSDINFRWEETCEFRNCVRGMCNRIFSYNELMDFAQESLNEENFRELHPISIILSEMDSDEYVVITSE